MRGNLIKQILNYINLISCTCNTRVAWMAKHTWYPRQSYGPLYRQPNKNCWRKCTTYILTFKTQFLCVFDFNPQQFSMSIEMGHAIYCTCCTHTLQHTISHNHSTMLLYMYTFMTRICTQHFSFLSIFQSKRSCQGSVDTCATNNEGNLLI